MIKSFQIRLYPTKEQEQCFFKHIGCCRFIWNYMIEYQNKLKEQEQGKYLSKFGMMNLITELKKEEEYKWLNEVSRTSLNIICSDLDFTYQKFFNKKINHPKFKTKKQTKQKYPVRYDSMYFQEKYVQIEKVGKVKYKTNYILPLGKGVCKFTDPRISFVNEKWILSFGMECEKQTFELSNKDMGIDLGVKNLAVVAFGKETFVFNNINKSKKMKKIFKQIQYLQKDISRKYRINKQGKKYIKTNNIIKQEKKLKKLYYKQKNIRKNYIHQTTHKLVSMLPKKVVMEDLNIQGLLKNKRMSRSICEQNWYEFKRQMKYKCEWHGINFVLANRFYPSSKKCSICGQIKDKLLLSERKYVCEKCGNIVDRDINAAINLMRYKV